MPKLSVWILKWEMMVVYQRTLGGVDAVVDGKLPRSSEACPQAGDSYIHAVCGVNPFASQYCLNPGEAFTTPKIIWAWSANGLGDMSRKLHRWARDYGLRYDH
jgi:hypothetical protein